MYGFLDRASYSESARGAIAAVFPQALPRAWRGGDGAEADTVDGAGCPVHLSLHRDERGAWWSEATYGPELDGIIRSKTTIQQMASSPLEAMRKLRDDLRRF